jgi:hypothetical protein
MQFPEVGFKAFRIYCHLTLCEREDAAETKQPEDRLWNSNIMPEAVLVPL